jgi:transposase
MIADRLAAEIRRLYTVEKWQVRTIARQLQVHHSVVERVLRQDGLARPPKPQRSQLDPWLPVIGETLQKYPTLCASRLYQMAVERGHRGSPDHFRHFVARHRPRKAAEAFHRLRTLPGEQGQVDWAHFGHVRVGRAERRLVGFVLVLSYSRRTFLRFGFDQGMAGFLDGHQRAFEHFGGVPRVLLYDNLKSAVLERFGEAIRMNPAMLAFSAHHGFEPRPVAVARGNEKGRVERTIRFVRTSFFAARDWTGLADLNRQALAWCDGLCAERAWPEDRARTVQSAFDEEQPMLLPLPQDRFPVHDRREVHSQKTPYVRYGLNDYSVPHTHVQRTLTVCATPDTVRVLDGDTAVAVHARRYDKAATVEDPAHVQGLTDHKRKARRHRAQDRLVEAVPAVRELLVKLAARGDALGSAVGQLAKLIDRHGAADLAGAVQDALAAGTPHPHNVRMLLERARHRRGLPEPVAVPLVQAPHLRDVHVKPHDLGGYDRLARARKPQADEEDPDD